MRKFLKNTEYIMDISMEGIFSFGVQSVCFSGFLNLCQNMNQLQTSSRHLGHSLYLLLILSCFFGIILGQTFQYSRGWTNGKKRSSVGPFLIQDLSEGQEVFGLCQMQRLKDIWESRGLDRDYLPCELMDQPDVKIMERLRRKGDCERNSILDSLPPQPN